MNTNEVRWKLHNYHTDCKMIEKIKEDLKEYRLMDGIKAQVITDMPISHSGTSKTESAAEKEYRFQGVDYERLDYIRKLEDKLDGMMRVKRAIDEVYMYLKEPKRTVIEMRYFILSNFNDVRQRKYNWAEIAIEVNLSEDYVKEIDGKIILQISNKIHQKTHV